MQMVPRRKVVKMKRPPPFLSVGSWAWRKQMSATDTRLQFTGDKNCQKTKHLHFLDMRVLNDFLLWTTCEIELTRRNFGFVNLPWAKLAWNWDCGVSSSGGRFWESHIISRNRFVTKKIYIAKFPTARYHVNTQRPACGHVWWYVKHWYVSAFLSFLLWF